MGFKNIQMSVVRRQDNGKKIKITEIDDKNRYNGYDCIICGTKVVAVVPNKKKKDGSNSKVTPHFKHKSAKACNSESLAHYWMKTELISIGDSFKILTDKERDYICSQIFFEKSIDVNGKKYIPDVTIITSEGETIYFEMKNTNGKNIKDYINTWELLNKTVVEVDINSLLTLSFKALYYDGKCFNLSDTNKKYIDIVEKYRITKADVEFIEQKKKEIEKLDYIWDRIRELNSKDDLSGIIKTLLLIESETSRKVAIDLIKNTRCNLMLQRYTANLLDKVNKKLKMLNLKYNGYLIRYETKIPHSIYDRIYKGIEVLFYSVNDCVNPFVHYVKDDKFNHNILTEDFKLQIDKDVLEIKDKENKIKDYIKCFNNSDKLIDIKYGYRQNTDYINAVFFKDYRHHSFVLFDENNEQDIYSLQYYIGDDIKYLPVSIYYDMIISETSESYEFNYKSKIIEDKIFFKFDKFIEQDKVILSYKKLNKDTNYLKNYNFKKATESLKDILNFIKKLCESKIEIDRNRVFYKHSLYSKYLNDIIRKIIEPIIDISKRRKDNFVYVCLDDNLLFNLYNFEKCLNEIGIETEIYY